MIMLKMILNNFYPTCTPRKPIMWQTGIQVEINFSNRFTTSHHEYLGLQKFNNYYK